MSARFIFSSVVPKYGKDWSWVKMTKVGMRKKLWHERLRFLGN